ncbi:MAG: hypothetical protein AB1540_12510 [Bdellovibrionota bacterium]
MERAPLFLSAGALLLWALISVFFRSRSKLGVRGLGLAMACVQLGSAIWAAVRIFAESSVVQWSGTWFALAENVRFELKFDVDATTMLFWLLFSVILALLEYFALMQELKGSKSQSSGEVTAIPLVSLGTLLTLSSGNLISFYFGWALVGFIGFVAIGFSSPSRDERARASFRYAILNAIPEIVFLAGTLGCYVLYGSLSFKEINEHSAGQPEAWPIVCLGLACMLRSLHFPLMQNVRYLASAKSSALPIFFIGHALLSATIFSKLYPALSSINGLEYLGIISAITALTSAVMALPEREPSMIAGWLVSYISASVFISGLTADYQAAQALAFNGVIVSFLVTLTLNQFQAEDRGSRWFVALAVVAFSGFPGTGWAGARYLEYLGLLHVGEQGYHLQWVLVGIKFVTDFILSVALWGVLRERWAAKTTKENLRIEIAIPVALVCLSCLAVLTGGRLFSGLLGNDGVELLPNFAWFERLVSIPVGSSRSSQTALELVGTDSDILARVSLVSILLFSWLLSMFLIFRDRESTERFKAKVSAFTDHLARLQGNQSLLWNWFISPTGKNLGRLAAFIDSRGLDYLTSDAWLKPMRFLKNAFIALETRLIDQKLVDGLAEAIATIGKSLRLVQNGQVQFYFAMGLILMGAIVAKFVVLGG